MSITIDARSLFAEKNAGQSFRNQNTIGRCAVVSGFGFWTGKDVTLSFHPAPPNSGITFVRTDLLGQPQIPARIGNREEKARQTSLVNQGIRVDMVEHVLAALNGLQIDNCEIWTDQPEMPGLDGSSQAFFAALQDAGIVAQRAKRPVRIVTRAFYVGTEHSYIIATTNRRGTCELQFSLVPEEGYPLSMQQCQFELSPEAFGKELALTRTFVTQQEAKTLLSQGLCQRVTPKDVLVLSKSGPVDNSFRYENECARHKTLDMIGDFALLGCDLIGTFESFRGSHCLNAECVRQILEKTMLLDTEGLALSREELKLFREAA